MLTVTRGGLSHLFTRGFTDLLHILCTPKVIIFACMVHIVVDSMEVCPCEAAQWSVLCPQCTCDVHLKLLLTRRIKGLRRGERDIYHHTAPEPSTQGFSSLSQLLAVRRYLSTVLPRAVVHRGAGAKEGMLVGQTR